jgi:hypothetical protein
VFPCAWQRYPDSGCIRGYKISSVHWSLIHHQNTETRPGSAPGMIRSSSCGEQFALSPALMNFGNLSYPMRTAILIDAAYSASPGIESINGLHGYERFRHPKRAQRAMSEASYSKRTDGDGLSITWRCGFARNCDVNAENQIVEVAMAKL